MDGEPVWLVSGSLRDVRGEIIRTSQLSGSQRLRVIEALGELLHGLGNEAHERCFRMNATICIHRALSADEQAALSPEWCALPAIHLAGGPVELLWSRGVQDKPSVRPCRTPGKQFMSPTLWVPVDCGRCEPCRARSAIEARVRRQIEMQRSGVANGA